MRWLFLAGTVFATIYTQLSATLPLTLRVRGLHPSAVGVLLALSALVMLAGQPLLTRCPLSRLPTFSALTLGYAALAVGLVGNRISHTLGPFLAATTVCSVADLVLLGRTSALVAGLAPPGQAAGYFAAYGLTWGLAGVIGPPLGTRVLDVGGPALLWLTMAAAAATLAFGHVLAGRRGTPDQR